MIYGRDLDEKRIRDMNIGETMYTLPWALGYDLAGQAFLNTGYVVVKRPYLASLMPITRFGPGKADYSVNTKFEFFNGKYEWVRHLDPFEGVGGNLEAEIVKLEEKPSPKEVAERLIKELEKRF